MQRPPQRNVVIEVLRALNKFTTKHVEENIDDVISYREKMSMEDSEHTTTTITTTVLPLEYSAVNFIPMEERSAPNNLPMYEESATNDFPMYKTPKLEGKQRDEPGTSSVYILYYNYGQRNWASSLLFYIIFYSDKIRVQLNTIQL